MWAARLPKIFPPVFFAEKHMIAITALTLDEGPKDQLPCFTTHFPFFLSLNPLALKLRRDSSTEDNVSIPLR